MNACHFKETTFSDRNNQVVFERRWKRERERKEITSRDVDFSVNKSFLIDKKRMSEVAKKMYNIQKSIF